MSGFDYILDYQTFVFIGNYFTTSSARRQVVTSAMLKSSNDGKTGSGP